MTFSHDDLLRALEQQDIGYQVGQTVQGKIASHSNDGVYIDIGGKAAAFLPLQEASLNPDQPIAEALPLNTEREFLIIRDQDADGQMTLSIRRLELKALWETLQTLVDSPQTLSVRVTGVNKGGVTADYQGLRGFIPRSHVVERNQLEQLVGQAVTVVVLEADEGRKKLVLSQRQAHQAECMNALEIGQLITGTVDDLRPFGAFVNVNGVRALLHINEISQAYLASLHALLPVGTPIKAIVTNLDPQRGRISLCTSVLENRPGEILEAWDVVMAEAEERAQRYQKQQAVTPE